MLKIYSLLDVAMDFSPCNVECEGLVLNDSFVSLIPCFPYNKFKLEFPYFVKDIIFYGFFPSFLDCGDNWGPIAISLFEGCGSLVLEDWSLLALAKKVIHSFIMVLTKFVKRWSIEGSLK